MGNLIDRSASAARLVEDVRETLAGGRVKAEPVRAVVVGALGGFVEADDRLGADRARQTEVVRRLRAVVKAENLGANDRIRRLHDEAFNDIGRSRNDPVFRLVYPRGGGTYALRPAASKAAALEENAGLLEIANHPQLSAAWVTAAAAELRALAAKVRAAVEALAPAAASLRLVEQAQRANARAARVALGRLKHTLTGMGLTEHAIHEIIPSRPRKAPAATASVETTASPAASASPARPPTGGTGSPASSTRAEAGPPPADDAGAGGSGGRSAAADGTSAGAGGPSS